MFVLSSIWFIASSIDTCLSSWTVFIGVVSADFDCALVESCATKPTLCAGFELDARDCAFWSVVCATCPVLVTVVGSRELGSGTRFCCCCKLTPWTTALASFVAFLVAMVGLGLVLSFLGGCCPAGDWNGVLVLSLALRSSAVVKLSGTAFFPESDIWTRSGSCDRWPSCRQTHC